MTDKKVHLISWGGRDVDIEVDEEGDVVFTMYYEDEGVRDFILIRGEFIGALKELGVIE